MVEVFQRYFGDIVSCGGIMRTHILLWYFKGIRGVFLGIMEYYGICNTRRGQGKYFKSIFRSISI